MKKPTDEGRLGVLSLLDRPTGNVGIELGVAAGLRRVVAAPIKRFLGGGGGENRECGNHSARGLY